MMPSRNDNLRYQGLDPEEIDELLRGFERRFEEFLEISGYPPDLEYKFSRYSLIDMIIRFDKKDVYFQCFHGMEINEKKQAGLYAYWILKMKPFFVTDIRYINDRSAELINESFAIYIIYAMLFFTKQLSIDTAANTKFYEKLLYSFRYRNLTIESLMLLTEAINGETFKTSYQDER